MGHSATGRGWSALRLAAPPVLAALLLLLPDPAMAQAASDVLDSAITGMKATLDRSAGRFGVMARQGLLALLVVDFVLRGGRAVLGGDSIADLMRGFAFQLGFVGFVWGVAVAVPDIVGFLAERARQIASVAGSGEASPGAIVTDGLSRAVSWLDEITLLSPGTWFYLVAAVISVIVLAIAVAMLVVVYAEFYLAGLAGMLALMFAGLSETRDIAMGYINSLIGKTFKLMGIMIVFAASGEMTSALAQGAGAGFGAAMGMITLQIVSAILILTLPATLEGLVGSRFSSRAAEAAGKMTGGVATTAISVGAGAAAGAASGAAAGAAGAARGGGTASGIASAALKGAGQGGVDWAAAVQNRDVMGAVGRRVARRLGHNTNPEDGA